jgi:murein DD-endopeptidase MepM/ murein hydrolase activator NlpD
VRAGKTWPLVPSFTQRPTANTQLPNVHLLRSSKDPKHTAVRHVACTLAMVVCALSTSLVGQDGRSLTMSASSRTMSPGSVVLLTVKSATPLASLSGQAFGRPVRFWETGPLEWRGLVAAGLEATPGIYDVDITGADTVAKTRLTVVRKQFETRRLRVGAEFVNPPVGEAERIASEAKRLATLFTRATPRAWRGAFQAPVSGTATSSFGRLTVLNGEPRGRHQGADFRAATGTPVVAPNAGRVVLAEDLYFSGNTVVIDHGLGMFSLLAHLSRINVTAGTDVARGEMLGLSGATGRVTGPHLHWALRLSEFSVDPLAVIAVLSDLKED